MKIVYFGSDVFLDVFEYLHLNHEILALYKMCIRDRVTGEAGAFCEKWEASPRQTYYVTMTIEELCVVILRDGGGDDVCIEITLVAGQQGEFVLHIRDTARYFDPFALETGRVSQEEMCIRDRDMQASGSLS